MPPRSVATATLSSFPPSAARSQEDMQLPLSPPCSPEDVDNLSARQRSKILHQFQQHASPTNSSHLPPSSFQASAPPHLSSNSALPPAPSTPDAVRVKAEICSPPISLRPSPSPPDTTQSLQRSSTPTTEPSACAPESQPPIENHQIGSSPTTRALRSLGLTRADLAQHAQRMKTFLVAGGRRGFPTAADLANADVKSEAADSDIMLTQSSTSSSRRQASVVSYTSSVCTTATTTDLSRASSSYPTGPSTNTSFDTTPSRERRPLCARAILPPLPPSSPPEMFSPVGSGESNRTGINSSPIRSPLASPAQAGPSRAYATADYSAGNDDPYILPPGPRTAEKPSASYAALIGQAIMSAVPGPDGKKKLTLAQIYAWISTAWPFYKPGEAGWMNSIRHNLSLNDCFIKVKRDGREKGKGSFWSIREGDEDMFANGGFVRRNSAAKKRKKDTTPTRDEPPPEPPKRTKNNPAPAPSASYVYEPPQYPPLPGTSRSAIASTSVAPANQPAPKRTRTATATSANKKSYRSPVTDHIPSSSPSRQDSGKRGYGHEYEGVPPELTPNMSSSPDMPGSSPISSSPPPPVTRPATRESPSEYPRKSGLMDMIINNSCKKRRVSGGAGGNSRITTTDTGSPVMKRRPNADEEEPRTIYPASMLSRPRSPTRHINPRVIIKSRAEGAAQAPENKVSHLAQPADSGASVSTGPEPITPPSHLPEQPTVLPGSDRPGHLVVKPSDIIPSTPPRTMAPLTMATSAERTPLSHAALHMSPSRPSDLSHFKNSVLPPSASYRDSPSHSMEFRTPLGRETRRVSSLSGSILAMSGESPMLRTPLGYGGPRDINDINSGCAEELMASPTARRLTVTSGEDQSPSMLFGGMYRSPEGAWSAHPNW